MDDVFQIQDKLWLEELFDEHHRNLLAYATRRIGSDGADDIATEAFAIARRVVAGAGNRGASKRTAVHLTCEVWDDDPTTWRCDN